MDDTDPLLMGKWTVWVKNWVWEYEFFPNGTVTWRDTRSAEKGSGRWSASPQLINISWIGSSATESWKRPLKLERSTDGVYNAPYYKGPTARQKILVDGGPPQFFKDPDFGLVGCSFTATGQLWRQELALGFDTMVGLRNHSGMSVELNNPAIAKLVKSEYRDPRTTDATVLYISIIPTGVGDAFLEARKGGAVHASMQIHVAANPVGAIYVDDFVNSYYDIDYRAEGGNCSKWLILEYRDSVAIEINLDQIVDVPSNTTPETFQSSPRIVGQGGRLFPMQLNRATAPRLCIAKRAANEIMNEYFVKFIQAAAEAVLFIITIDPFVGGVAGAGTLGKAVRKPIPRGKLPPGVRGVLPKLKAAAERLRSTARDLQGKNPGRAVEVLSSPRTYRHTITADVPGVSYARIEKEGSMRLSTGAKAHYGEGVYAWPPGQSGVGTYIDIEVQAGTGVETLDVGGKRWVRMLPPSGDTLPVRIAGTNMPQSKIDMGRQLLGR